MHLKQRYYYAEFCSNTNTHDQDGRKETQFNTNMKFSGDTYYSLFITLDRVYFLYTLYYPWHNWKNKVYLEAVVSLFVLRGFSLCYGVFKNSCMGCSRTADVMGCAGLMFQEILLSNKMLVSYLSIYANYSVMLNKASIIIIVNDKSV